MRAKVASTARLDASRVKLGVAEEVLVRSRSGNFPWRRSSLKRWSAAGDDLGIQLSALSSVASHKHGSAASGPDIQAQQSAKTGKGSDGSSSPTSPTPHSPHLSNLRIEVIEAQTAVTDNSISEGGTAKDISVLHFEWTCEKTGPMMVSVLC